MVEGYCSSCGKHLVGWALLLPRHQTCPECSRKYLLTQDGREISNKPENGPIGMGIRI